MTTLFYTVVNRCFGRASNILLRPNSRRILVSYRQISLRENVLQRIYTQTLLTRKINVEHFTVICSSHVKHVSTETPLDKPSEQKKLSLYQRLKAMYKDYWYVLVPVHCLTSACWYGGFYYMAKSGVDIVALLESLNISEKLIQPLRDGHATTGYLALAYALYKLSTPLRYTVTIGGTTISINYLKHWGYIKPMPSKEQLKVLYKERRDTFHGKKQEIKDTFQERKQEIKESFEERKQEIRENVIQKLKDIDRKKKM